MFIELFYSPQILHSGKNNSSFVCMKCIERCIFTVFSRRNRIKIYLHIDVAPAERNKKISQRSGLSPRDSSMIARMIHNSIVCRFVLQMHSLPLLASVISRGGSKVTISWRAGHPGAVGASLPCQRADGLKSRATSLRLSRP